MKTSDISPRFIELSQRADDVDVEKALDLLIEMFLDNCGISLSVRTVAENASFYWIERWREKQPELPRDLGLFEAMKLRSERYLKEKERFDRYDIAVLRPVDLHKICLEMIDETDDRNEQIALAAGVLPYLERSIKIHDDFVEKLLNDIHLINSKGETTVTDWTYLVMAERNGRTHYDRFRVNIDWYKDNGYDVSREDIARCEDMIKNGLGGDPPNKLRPPTPPQDRRRTLRAIQPNSFRPVAKRKAESLERK